MKPELNEIGYERSEYILYIQVLVAAILFASGLYALAKKREDYLEMCAKDELDHEN